MMKKWNEKLERAFESTNQDLSLMESRQTFELNADNSSLENLSYIHSVLPEKESIHSVFTQLSPFFEVGFLFEKQKDSNLAIDAFAFGQPIFLGSQNILLRLPRTKLFHIAKTPAPAILKKLNHSFVNPERKMTAFVVAISDTYSLLLGTEIAEPWLKVRLEVLQKTLMKIHFT